MNLTHGTVHDTYRLIVTRRNASEILLRPRGSTWCLPSVEIPRGQRIAEQLGAELYAQCGCRGYCLLVSALADELRRCAVMEVPSPNQIASTESFWKPRDAATYSSIEPAEDRTLIERSIEELSSCRRKPNEAPFARPGWLQELFAWANQRLEPWGVRLMGGFAQWNASATCSLIRLQTNKSAVWFKAAGGPNRHELAVTGCLARLFPGYVPELLGVHAAWNGWLMREIPGRTLDHSDDISPWLQTAAALARLQVQSIGKQTELLDAACLDLRLPRLIEEINPFVGRMRRLMAAQEKASPAPLTEPQLRYLRDCLNQACSRLLELSLPDTLGHIDFNPGNILVSPGRSVFLDWAEACLTNPLVTLEYFREHFRRNFSNDRTALEAATAAYTEPWQALVSMNDLKQAALFSPLVAVFAYAVGAGARRSSEPCGNSSEGAYLRSLARRMFREAGQLADRSELCLA
jgi:hypothetical protein